VSQLTQRFVPLSAAIAAETSLNFDSAHDLCLNLEAAVEQHSATSLVQAVHLTLFFLLAKSDPMLFFKPLIHVFLFLSIANIVIQLLLFHFLLLQPLKVPLILQGRIRDRVALEGFIYMGPDRLNTYIDVFVEVNVGTLLPFRENRASL